jgi:hypothetical protein
MAVLLIFRICHGYSRYYYMLELTVLFLRVSVECHKCRKRLAVSRGKAGGDLR